MKKAFITGVTGQDGSYLSELLLDREYEVHGLVRRTSTGSTERIRHLQSDQALSDRFHLHRGDITDAAGLRRIVEEVQPDEVYNLAAQSNVAASFEQPAHTTNVNALGTLRLLEALKETGGGVRFFQASTSEMFGNVDEVPQDEETPFQPTSPYGTSKLYAHWMTRNYRTAHGLFASSGIMFNHESPRRGQEFVTQKVVRAAVRISNGEQEELRLGNLDAHRDWGYAPEYMDAAHRMLQADEPDDYVIATGETHSVRELTEAAFEVVGMEVTWEGSGVEEVGRDPSTGEIVVTVDPDFFRPADVDHLVGDPSKAEDVLNWSAGTSFPDLVRKMVNGEMDGTPP